MRGRISFPFKLAAFLIAVLVCGAPADAQTKLQRNLPKRDKTPLTQINVLLLTGDEGVGRHAQQWGNVFKELDVLLTIRRATYRDKPGISERNFGDSVRRVKVIARIDKRGRLILSDRAFSISERAKLNEWLRELRTYGAQGAPQGKPVWGLSKEQFEALLRPLKVGLKNDPQGNSLPEALAVFGLGNDFPFFPTTSAQQVMDGPQSRQPFRQSLISMSKGTALAIVLKQYGLGFRPRRTPGGDIELAIDTLEGTEKCWKIGWPLTGRRPVTAPKLFELVPVELKDLPLDTVLQAASERIEVPILFDDAALREKNIDISQIMVSHPSRKTSWSLVLKTLVFQAKLRLELLIDEAGKPFIWVTPIKFKGTKRSRRPVVK